MNALFMAGGSGRHPRRRRWLLWVTALVFLVLNTLDICVSVPRNDGQENLTAGYQTLRYGEFATRVGTEKQRPDNWREPVPAVIWAAALALHPDLDVDDDSYRCITGREERCREDVAQLKFAMVLLGTLAALLTGLLVQHVTGRTWLALMSMAGALATASYVAHQDRFYSEAVAACLLAAISVLPALGTARARARPIRWIAVGTCFALLVLTKAILYYCILPYLALVAWDTWTRTRRWRAVLRTALAFAAPVVLLVGGWMLRNYVKLDVVGITRRGADVLYARAAMNELLYPRYSVVTAYYAGGPFWRAVGKDVSEEERDAFRGQGKDGFRKAKKKRRIQLRREVSSNVEAEKLLLAEAKQRILDDVPRHLAMTVPVALRGMDVASSFGFPNSFGCKKTLAKKYFGWTLPKRLLTTPYYFNWLLFASLFGGAAFGLARRRRWLLFFTFPAVYFFTMYAGLTHFIPRYSVPSVPIVFAAFALALHVLLRRVGHFVRRVKAAV